MSRTPLDFALDYAEHGLVVIPLARMDTSKTHPMLKNGFSYDWISSNEPQNVRKFWEPGQWWRHWTWKERRTQVEREADWEYGDPAANVGVVTGERSGVLVLDVDRKRVDGRESLIKWQRETGHSFGDCPAVSTPGNGVHLWLRLREGQEVRRKVGWLPGVDACGSGGFVAMPPSIRLVHVSSPKPWEPSHAVKREYEWFRGSLDDMPEAPDWLIEDINSRPVTVTRRDGQTVSTGAEGLPPTVDFRAAGLGWYTGSRNMDLYRLSYRLWNGIMSEEEVINTVRECFENTADKTDFSWDEVLKTVYSARERRRRFSPSLSEMMLKWTGKVEV